MTLHVDTFVLGRIDNNTYLLWDEATRQAVVIDPSFDPAPVIEAIAARQVKLTGVWLTHGHFDHFIGIPELLATQGNIVPILIHPEDLEMYKTGGLGGMFGIPIPELPEPDGLFADGQFLSVGDSRIEVRHTPGHSAGHVVFYSEEIATVFTGDLIFKQSVGRTDIPGSDQDALLRSIYTQILTLPGETRILPGHNDETTVDEEVEFNPYLN
jgi:glyoxylase-like metal-dependent hydrolase (beta-lactamase superfamily II)